MRPIRESVLLLIALYFDLPLLEELLTPWSFWEGMLALMFVPCVTSNNHSIWMLVAQSVQSLAHRGIVGHENRKSSVCDLELVPKRDRSLANVCKIKNLLGELRFSLQATGAADDFGGCKRASNKSLAATTAKWNCRLERDQPSSMKVLALWSFRYHSLLT